MKLRKIVILVLCGLWSYDSLAALPRTRTGVQNTGQSQRSSGVTSRYRASISGTSGSGNSGSSSNIVGNIAQPPKFSVSNAKVPNKTTAQQIANFEELMEQVKEQNEIINTLRVAIERKDDEIREIKGTLVGYKNLEATVKDMPNAIRTEINGLDFSTVRGVQDELKKYAKKEETLDATQVQNIISQQKFVKETVLNDRIAAIKGEAIEAATAEVYKTPFMTAETALELGFAKAKDLDSQITAAKLEAKDEAAQAATAQIAAVKNEVLQVATAEIAAVKVEVKDEAVRAATNEIDKKGFLTKTGFEQAVSDAGLLKTSELNTKVAELQIIKDIPTQIAAVKVEVKDEAVQAATNEIDKKGFLTMTGFEQAVSDAGLLKTSELDTKVAELQVIKNIPTQIETKVSGMGLLKTSELDTKVAELQVIKDIPTQIAAVKVEVKDEAVQAATNEIDKKGFLTMTGFEQAVSDAGLLKTSELNTKVAELQVIRDIPTQIENKVSGMDLLKAADLNTKVAELQVIKDIPTQIAAVKVEVKDEAVQAATNEIDKKGFLTKTGFEQAVSDAGLLKTSELNTKVAELQVIRDIPTQIENKVSGMDLLKAADLNTKVAELQVIKDIPTQIENKVSGMDLLKAADLNTKVAELQVIKDIPTQIAAVKVEVKDEAVQAATNEIDKKGFLTLDTAETAGLLKVANLSKEAQELGFVTADDVDTQIEGVKVEIVADTKADKDYIDEAKTDVMAAQTAAQEAELKVAAAQAEVAAAQAEVAVAKKAVAEAKAEAEQAKADAKQFKLEAELAKADAEQFKLAALDAKSAAESARGSAETAVTNVQIAATQVISAKESATAAQSAAELAQAAAEQAKADAEGFKLAALDAQSAAESAQGAAESAKGAAEEAKELAKGFKIEAEGFKVAALAAQDAAEEAKELAKGFKAEAEGFKLAALDAKSAAESARGSAETAVTNVQLAVTQVNSAKESATAAQAAAEQAKEKAEEFKTAAEAAEGKASVSLTVAERAIASAESAIEEAHSAKKEANSAIEEANEAKSLALGAQAAAEAAQDAAETASSQAQAFMQMTQGLKTDTSNIKDQAAELVKPANLVNTVKTGLTKNDIDMLISESSLTTTVNGMSAIIQNAQAKAYEAEIAAGLAQTAASKAQETADDAKGTADDAKGTLDELTSTTGLLGENGRLFKTAKAVDALHNCNNAWTCPSEGGYHTGYTPIIGGTSGPTIFPTVTYP